MLSSINRKRVAMASCFIGFVMGSLLLIFMARDMYKGKLMADRRRKLTRNTINQVRRPNSIGRRLAQSGSRFQPAVQRRLR